MNNVKFKLDTTNFPKKVNVIYEYQDKTFDKCMNKKRKCKFMVLPWSH